MDTENKVIKNDIQVLNLSFVDKTPIQIDGDPENVLYLNLHDVNILGRVEEAIPKITQALEEYQKSEVDTDNREDTKGMISNLVKIDNIIRTQLNYIFDTNVCKAILGNASTLSPVNGTIACIVIMEKLFELYKDNLSAEFGKLESQVQQKLSKYIK